MEDLIKALQILLKYGNPKYPTVCCHDELRIVGIEPEIISDIDKLKLKSLGIHLDKLTDEQKKYLSSWEAGT